MLTRAAIAPILLASLAGAAPDLPRALLTSSSGLPNELIPGTSIPISSFTQADLRLSLSGTYWAINVNTSSQPAPDNGWVVVGTPTAALSGFTRSATTADPAIGFPMATRPDTPFGVNDSGDVAFSVALGGTAPFATNEIALRWNRASNSFTTIAREGSPIPGIPGEFYGGIHDSVTLLNDGRASLRDGSTSGALPSSQDEFYFLVGPTLTDNVSALVQSDTFAPTNQAGGTTTTIDDVFEGFTNADGTSYIAEIGLFPPASGTRALVVDGAVVLQTLNPIPGVTGLPTNVGEFEMFPGGDWAVHGFTDIGTSFLLVNGTIRLLEGDTFPQADAGETVRSIVDVDINANGDIAASLITTLGGSVAYRELVLVLPADGSDPVAPYIRGSFNTVTLGTRLDLDGDGLGEDAYFFSFFEDSLAIDNDGNVYVACRALNSADQTEADALVIVDAFQPQPCSPADITNDGTVDSGDLAAFITAFLANDLSVDFTNDGTVDSGDLALFIDLFLTGC
jgi:hypothetical protein